MKKLIILIAVTLIGYGQTSSQSIELPIQTVKNLKNAADSGRACAADMRLRVAEIYQLNILMVSKDSVIRGRGLMVRDLINEKRAEVALKENEAKQKDEQTKRADFAEKKVKKLQTGKKFISGVGVVVAGILTTLLLSK